MLSSKQVSTCGNQVATVMDGDVPACQGGRRKVQDDSKRGVEQKINVTDRKTHRQFRARISRESYGAFTQRCLEPKTECPLLQPIWGAAASREGYVKERKESLARDRQGEVRERQRNINLVCWILSTTVTVQRLPVRLMAKGRKNKRAFERQGRMGE